MEYLNTDEVLTIRRRLATTEIAARDFGRTEPLQPLLLASAVSRQTAGWGASVKYHRVEEIAATLLYGLTLNHAFENGNKRTALVSMLVLLDRNNVLLVDATEDELYDLATRVAAHTFDVSGDPERNPNSEVAGISAWLSEHTRPRQKGDSHMEFKELKRQLVDQGCAFDKHSGNYIKIHRKTPSGGLSVKTGYPKASFTVGVGEVKRIRRALQLDEQHGVDSGAFYGDLDAVVDHFVNTHRQVLDRLAET